MSVCTPIAIGTPPQRMWPSVSRNTELVGVIETHAAVLGGLVDAEIALVAHLLEEIVGGEDAGLLPFVDVRVDLAVDEFLHAAANALVLLGEFHGVSPRGVIPALVAGIQLSTCSCRAVAHDRPARSLRRAGSRAQGPG
jgi:hypothetical protein